MVNLAFWRKDKSKKNKELDCDITTTAADAFGSDKGLSKTGKDDNTQIIAHERRQQELNNVQNEVAIEILRAKKDMDTKFTDMQKELRMSQDLNNVLIDSYWNDQKETAFAQVLDMDVGPRTYQALQEAKGKDTKDYTGSKPETIGEVIEKIQELDERMEAHKKDVGISTQGQEQKKEDSTTTTTSPPQRLP